MTNIAFIGLGIMGSPMAVHLAKAGHQVAGYNRSPEKAAPLVDAGGRAAESIADAVRDADVVCLMVPDSPDVPRCSRARAGSSTAPSPARSSSTSPASAPTSPSSWPSRPRPGASGSSTRPVSGGEAGAVNAALSIMVGGEADDFEAAKPYLDVVGKTVVHVGPSGSGQTVKAANQLIVAANIQALAEAVVFLEAYGVDTEAALEVLGGGLAGSKVLDQKKQNMLDRSFEPGFRIDLHHKDLGIVTAAAREAGVVVPAGRARRPADGLRPGQRRRRTRPLRPAARCGATEPEGVES